jgi:hypothetical protein
VTRTRWSLLLATVLAVGCAHERTAPPSQTEQPTAAEALATGSSDGGEATAPPATAPVMANGQPSTVPPKPRPVKIKIIVRSNPPKAFVFWGKKNLGPTPLTIERPRDSGPVDLVIRNDGYFPLHTRAYTVRNDAVYVKLTKLEERMSLFGAKRDPNEAPPLVVPPPGAAEADATPPPAPPSPLAPPAPAPIAPVAP